MRTKTPQQLDKMLDAAARLFGAKRFHEVRMEDIASEAGVGKGTLYRYFSDKDELYLALLRRSSHQFVHRLEEHVAREKGARAGLEALVATVLSYFHEQPHLLDLIQRAEVARGLGPEFPWHKTRDEVKGLVIGLFARGEETGEFRVRDPELTALLLLGGIRSVIRFGDNSCPQAMSRRIVSLVLEGSGAASH